MITSFMTRQNIDRNEAWFECERVGGSGEPIIREERSVLEEEMEVAEEEKKQWVRRKVELPNFDGRALRNA